MASSSLRIWMSSKANGESTIRLSVENLKAEIWMKAEVVKEI